MTKHVRKSIAVKLPYVSSNEDVVVDDDKDGKTTKDVEEEKEEEEENKDGKDRSPSNHDQDGINCNA